MEQRGLFDAPPPPPGSIQARFEAWLARNPHVYERFTQAARALKQGGRKRYGAKAIYEHMRFHMALPTDGDAYKLNNNWTSRLARKLLSDHPAEFGGFLELRRLQAE